MDHILHQYLKIQLLTLFCMQVTANFAHADLEGDHIRDEVLSWVRTLFISPDSRIVNYSGDFFGGPISGKCFLAVTNTLEAYSIVVDINSKEMIAMPLDRISNDFDTNITHLSEDRTKLTLTSIRKENGASVYENLEVNLSSTGIPTGYNILRTINEQESPRAFCSFR